MLLLTLVSALGPRVLPSGVLLEQYYASTTDRLRTLMNGLSLLCKRNMTEDTLIPHDVLTNNTTHIVHVIAYLYVTRQRLGKSDQARSV